MTIIKKSVMTLHSGTSDVYSHRVRIVLAEKGVTVDIIHIDSNNPSQDLIHLNPYNTVPTLVDRELVLYEPSVIMEYLDERFPHPPLLPVYPIARAKCRLMMHRIEKDWFSLVNAIETGKKAEVNEARKLLKDQLTNLAPLFNEMPYFLSESFSLVDCYIAPLLWRLPTYDIELSAKQGKAISEYSKRIFARPSFQASLSDIELELREEYDT